MNGLTGGPDCPQRPSQWKMNGSGQLAKVQLDYVNEYTVGGKTFRYYRRAGRRIRLQAAPGTVEFAQEYHAAEALTLGTVVTAPQGETIVAGSLKALFTAYKASPAFRTLSAGTRANYTREVEALYPKFANLSVATLPREWILHQQDAMAATPRKANHLVAVLRLLLNWGIDRGWRPDGKNPALRIKPLKTGPGHRRWTDAEFLTMTGPGAEEIALGVLLGFYTAQRVSDVLALPWSAYNGSSITLRQGKTGRDLTIEVRPELKRVLDALKRALRKEGKISPAIFVRPDGKKWTRSHFTHRLAAIRDELKLPKDLHFHGLRHTILSALAEKGASAPELQGLGGHKSLASLQGYITQAAQKPLAAGALAHLPRRARAKKKAPAK